MNITNFKKILLSVSFVTFFSCTNSPLIPRSAANYSTEHLYGARIFEVMDTTISLAANLMPKLGRISSGLYTPNVLQTTGGPSEYPSEWDYANIVNVSIIDECMLILAIADSGDTLRVSSSRRTEYLPFYDQYYADHPLFTMDSLRYEPNIEFDPTECGNQVNLVEMRGSNYSRNFIVLVRVLPYADSDPNYMIEERQASSSITGLGYRY